MKASFIHIADTHLGYEQYGVRERFNDFSRAFWDIIDDALYREADFLVIAGDLFHKRAIDALTLIHAIEGLKKLKAKGIPVIAIEGNHDRSYYREGISWLQFLCHEQYVTLLNPRMRDGAPGYRALGTVHDGWFVHGCARWQGARLWPALAGSRHRS